MSFIATDARTIATIQSVRGAIGLTNYEERYEAILGLYLHAEPNDANRIAVLYAMLLARCPEAVRHLADLPDCDGLRVITSDSALPQVVSAHQ